MIISIRSGCEQSQWQQTAEILDSIANSFLTFHQILHRLRLSCSAIERSASECSAFSFVFSKGDSRLCSHVPTQGKPMVYMMVVTILGIRGGDKILDHLKEHLVFDV
ncbi:hypothetical protein M758_6G204900 [Ceratodon purpureus]|nr:hypothetical protein M758_6G204900 [Ceratodon purpureus]